MVVRDLKWLRAELKQTITDSEEPVFIHEKIWDIINWDDNSGQSHLSYVARGKKLSIAVGQLTL